MSLSSTSDASSENPGASMAAAVDEEVTKYRSLEEDIIQKRGQLRHLLSQQNENEMVKQELGLLSDNAVVYKMVGPVLLKNELDDAKMTVNKRLEFISGEVKKVESSLEQMEKHATEVARKVNEMQSLMQKAAVEAAKAVAAEHAK
jgi:prefoldin beta subunit